MTSTPSAEKLSLNIELENSEGVYLSSASHPTKTVVCVRVDEKNGILLNEARVIAVLTQAAPLLLNACREALNIISAQQEHSKEERALIRKLSHAIYRAIID